MLVHSAVWEDPLIRVLSESFRQTPACLVGQLVMVGHLIEDLDTSEAIPDKPEMIKPCKEFGLSFLLVYSLIPPTDYPIFDLLATEGLSRRMDNATSLIMDIGKFLARGSKQISSSALRQKRYRQRQKTRAVRPSQDKSSNTELSLFASADLTAEEIALVGKVFPCRDGEEWTLTEQVLVDARASFPALDICGEIAKALFWIKQNSDRRKTKRGMKKFISNWLINASKNPRSPERVAGSPSDILEKLKNERHARIQC